MDVPVLETERLRLRGHCPEDWVALAAVWADPLVVRYIGAKPSTPQQSWGRILNYAGLWAMLGYGYWALEDKATGRYLGDVGFADFKREIQPSIHGVPELGWVLAPHAHGKGFATEAVKAAIEWGRSRLPAPRIVCIIDPGNAASIRVAEKAGFQEIARTAYLGEPTILYERGVGG